MFPTDDLNADTILGILDDAPASTDAPEGSDSVPEQSTEPVLEQPDGAEQTEQVEQPEQTEQTPVEEPTVESPTEEQPPSDVEFDAEVGPPKVTSEKSGEKIWHYPESRGRTLYAGYQESKKYKEIAPTVEEAVQHRDAYVDTLAMTADLRSADPVRVGRFIQYWGSKAPQSMEAFGLQFLSHAKANNPNVYSSIASSAVTDIAEQLYREYASHPNKDSDEAQRLLYGAQTLDVILGRSYKNPDTIKAPDPAAERLADIERREQLLRKRDADQIQSARAGFKGTTDAEIRKVFDSDVEEALKPLADLKKSQPLIYKAAVNELQTAVRQAISTDKAWNNIFRLKYDEALGRMTEEDRKQLVTMFQNRARRAIANAKAEIISAASKSMVQQSQETHKRLADAASRKEPGTGAPVKPTTSGKLAGETLGEKINNLLGI